MENVTRLTTLTAIVPAFAAATFAGSASAQTVITEYGDLTALDSGREQTFDLDGDDIDDFGFGIKNFFAKQVGIDKPVFSQQGRVYSLNEPAEIARPSESTFAQEFFAGDTVSADDFDNGEYVAKLYVDDQGPLDFAEDTMFVGLSLSLFPDTILTDVANNGTSTEARVADVSSVFYGWAEFERGSLTLLRTGFNPNGGAAVIPGMSAVPVPASLLLLATGAAGLGALRRHQRKAA